MSATWTTDPTTGLVHVDLGDGAGTQTPVLSAKEEPLFRSKVLAPWGELIAKYAARADVPPAHVAGLIWRESMGNPNVVSFDGGVGLMQLTTIKRGHTNEELKDPELNINIGSEYFGRLWHEQKGDLPRAAAAYNAGSARPCSRAGRSCDMPWGLVATPGHILGVVSASNTALAGEAQPFPKLPIHLPTFAAASSGGAGEKALALALGAAAGYAAITASAWISRRWAPGAGRRAPGRFYR